MKKLVLLLLAFGMYVSSFAQPEISIANNKSDKWVITLVPGMKGELGRLKMNFSAGANWTISIYTQADNKMVQSFYQADNPKSYDLSPGKYRIKLENVTVENVPVRKGHETRLKAGFLDISLPGIWTVADESKQKMYANSQGDYFTKMFLPVGVYYVGNAGAYRRIVIKDKETVVLNPIKSTAATKWVITSMAGLSSASAGRLNTYFPDDSIRSLFIDLNDDGLWGYEEYVPPDQKSYNLTAGKHRINLNKVVTENVPVKNGKETRIKAGYLLIINPTDSSWKLIAESQPGNPFATPDHFWNKGKAFWALPVGNYWLQIRWGVMHPMVIKDKKTTKVGF